MCTLCIYLCASTTPFGYDIACCIVPSGSSQLTGSQQQQQQQQLLQLQQQLPLDSESLLVSQHEPEDARKYPFYNIRRYRPYFDVDTNVSAPCVLALKALVARWQDPAWLLASAAFWQVQCSEGSGSCMKGRHSPGLALSEPVCFGNQDCLHKHLFGIFPSVLPFCQAHRLIEQTCMGHIIPVLALQEVLWRVGNSFIGAFSANFMQATQEKPDL